MKRHSSEIGKFKRYCKKKDNSYCININSEWLPMTIIIILVFIFGIIVISIFLKHSKFAWQIVYIAFFIITFIVLVLLCVVDPGIVDNSGSIVDVENKKDLVCTYCNTMKSQNARHCYDCGVCIYNYDHHCDVIGKCIGRNNLCLFYLFVFLLPTFFIVSIIFISSAV